MLYRDNDHAGRAGYQTPGSRSLTQVHINVDSCHWLPRNYQKRVIKLIRGSKNLKLFQLFHSGTCNQIGEIKHQKPAMLDCPGLCADDGVIQML